MDPVNPSGPGDFHPLGIQKPPHPSAAWLGSLRLTDKRGDLFPGPLGVRLTENSAHPPDTGEPSPCTRRSGKVPTHPRFHILSDSFACPSRLLRPTLTPFPPPGTSTEHLVEVAAEDQALEAREGAQTLQRFVEITASPRAAGHSQTARTVLKPRGRCALNRGGRGDPALYLQRWRHVTS